MKPYNFLCTKLLLYYFRLDNCLKDMLTLTNKIVGKEYVTPKDALLSMLSNHSLENDTCYDPDPDAVSEILTHAVSDDILIYCEFLRPVILFCTDMSVR